MKINTIKIIILNIILLVIILFISDYSIYLKFKQDYIKNLASESLKIYPPISYIDNYKSNYSTQSYIFQERNKNNFNYLRKNIYNTSYNKKGSIIFFGCSYTFGIELSDEQTLSNKIAKKLNINVYNFGICASGIQHMLSLLQNNIFYNLIKEEPKYAIYTIIPDHFGRLQKYIFPSPMMANGINLHYELKNSKLKKRYIPLNIFSKSFLVKSFFYQIDTKINDSEPNTKEQNNILAYYIFTESFKILKKKYPNIKFIILRYETEEDLAEEYEDKEIWENLKKQGIIIINSSDLIGRKFRYASEDTCEDDYHPSEKAWELLIPKLIEKIDL